MSNFCQVHVHTTKLCEVINGLANVWEGQINCRDLKILREDVESSNRKIFLLSVQLFVLKTPSKTYEQNELHPKISTFFSLLWLEPIMSIHQAT